jgi:ribosomal protein L16 Arg81 hydroxylase
MGAVAMGTDTWGASSLLGGAAASLSPGDDDDDGGSDGGGLVVFEGVLSPGEILYIPPGAPHAAHTLDDCLMVASNDGSEGSMELLRRACEAGRADPSLAIHGNGGQQPVRESCYEDETYEAELHTSMLRNLREHRGAVRREQKPFLQAYRCAGARYCSGLYRAFANSPAVHDFCRARERQDVVLDAHEDASARNEL